MSVSLPTREFTTGARNTLPLVFGAVPFGVLFGVLALTVGLPGWAAQAMSVLVFAGASQFIAVGLIAAGTAYPFIVLTTLIVNLRHALYGASIAADLQHLPRAWQLLLAFGMTDESFAVTVTHYRDTTRAVAHKHWYFLGANLALYVPWQIATAFGYWLGNALGDPMALGLDFTLPLVFIGILVPSLKTRAALMAALAAGLVAVLAFALPNKLGLILAIGAGVAAGLGVEKWISRY